MKRKREKIKVGWRRTAVCAGSGALGAACFYVPDAAFLLWILPVPALALLFAEGEGSGRDSRIRVIKLVAAFTLPFFFCSYLVGFTIDVYFPRPLMLLLDLALILVATLVQGLPQMVALAVGVRLKLPAPVRAAAVALLWTVAEWLTTIGPFAFPVRLFAVSQWKFVAAIKTSSLFGQLFISFLMVFFAALLALSYNEWRKDALKRRPAAALLIAACAVFVINIAAGSIATRNFADSGDGLQGTGATAPELSESAGRTMRIAAVQHNQPITDDDRQRFERACEQARSILESGDYDLLVLPESTAQFVRSDKYMQARLSDLAKTFGTDIITGGAHRVSGEPAGEQTSQTGAGGEGSGLVNLGKARKDGVLLENAVHLFTRDGGMSAYYYAKQQLVPFFENGNIQKFSFLSGDERGVFETSSGRVGAIVCFESVLQQTVRDTVLSGAEVIVVPSNDAYLGEEIRRMHLSQAVFRALETDRAVVQVATNGITAAAYPDGSLVSVPMNEQTMLTAVVPVSGSETLYVKYGNLWILVCGALLALYIALSHLRLRRKTLLAA
ncbi:MAG: apolipoprotein N-acyltransferase [Clostridiales Family XIII bacterium]|jgi:apolipoprotein N-acyltransferase|nr:apolipoprotein N-acyltransferase [Clostridiales Family XIII bacterium]